MWHQYIWAIYESNKLFTLVEYMCISGDAAAWVFKKKQKAIEPSALLSLTFPLHLAFLLHPRDIFFQSRLIPNRSSPLYFHPHPFLLLGL